MEHSHYFIGIPIPKDEKRKLQMWQQQLQKHVEYKVWPNPEDFHITLKFLGGVPNEKIQELIDRFNQTKFLPSFPIEIGTIGSFGNPKTPRVIWAGVTKNEKLQNLQTTVEMSCDRLGFSKENRPYRPHITLAKKWRGKEDLKGPVDSLIENTSEMEWIQVEYFHLYQIHPNKTQKYEVVKTWELRN